FSHDCACPRKVTNVADQLEAKGLGWKAYGEGMGAACTLTDDANTGYAVRHVPFLYYDGIQGKPDRCKAHVVDLLPGGVSTAADGPVPLIVVSPFAKTKFESKVKADHYTLLATIEDALALGGRLGQAGKQRTGMADTLSDFFPAQ